MRRRAGVVRASAIEMAPVPTPVVAAPDVPADRTALEAAARAAAQAKEAEALRGLLGALGGVVKDLKARRPPTIDEIARLSVEVGVALAERLLCAEIVADRQRLDRIVQHALERLPGSNSVAVRAHPDDIVLLERQLLDNADLKGVRETLTLKNDGSLPRGHLKLEADDWFAEWNTATALTELRGILLEETSTDG